MGENVNFALVGANHGYARWPHGLPRPFFPGIVWHPFVCLPRLAERAGAGEGKTNARQQLGPKRGWCETIRRWGSGESCEGNAVEFAPRNRGECRSADPGPAAGLWERTAGDEPREICIELEK